MTRTRFTTLALAAVAAAAVLRLWDLDRRPMHTDEAVHGLKFGEVLASHALSYDPEEYHGPSLNAATLVPALVRGQNRLDKVDETTLRLVPAVFGIGLAALALALRAGLGPAAVLWAALFTAVSPSMTFYSRYYIQEILFVFFTFCLVVSAWRYGLRPGAGWALAAGASAGLMHATKETCVIVWAAAAAAWFATGGIKSIREGRVGPFRRGHALLAAGAAVFVSLLVYSSLFTRPSGALDSLRFVHAYLDRAGSNPFHRHSWTYYLHILGFWKAAGGPAWTEISLFGLGLIGAVSGFVRGTGRDGRLVRFLAAYAVVLTAFYSAIPYKTPWNLLGFWHAWILLAGAGAGFLVRSIPVRAVGAAAGAAAAAHLALQSCLAVGPYDCDPANPYVYAHPGREVPALSEAVHRAASVSDRGAACRIEVAFPDHGYWPLPWYFRDLPNTAWTDAVDTASQAGDVILAPPLFEQDVARKLYEIPPPGERPLYLPLFDRPLPLRPGVDIDAWTRRDIFMRMEAQPGPPQ